MGKKTSLGSCEICGANAGLRNTRGHMACSTCERIIGYVENKLERIAAVAKLLEKEKTLAELLGSPARADANIEKSARAWDMLMERAREYGFSIIADAEPEIMAGTYIMAMIEIMRERDRLKSELERANEDKFASKNPINDALLEWALEEVSAGRLSVNVQVNEVASIEEAITA